MSTPLMRGGAWDSCGRFQSAGRCEEPFRYHLAGRAAGRDPIRLGLLGGVPGDKPAGSLALLQFLERLVIHLAKAAGYWIFAHPWGNPTGGAVGTRQNRAGRNLNWEFWRESEQPEVKALESEPRAQRFHGLIALHPDDAGGGPYGCAAGRPLDDAFLRPALLAAERVFPRDQRAPIDGFNAREGITSDCFPGILAGPPKQRARPFNLILATPARVPLADQAAANVAAWEAVPASSRGDVACGQDL
jgi:hypothetical protein